MGNIRAILILAVFFVGAPLHAGGAAPGLSIAYTDEKLEIIPEARMFQGHIGGIDFVGADIGPKDGTPAVLVGGFTSTFPYLRKFIRGMNRQGFRVFVYNPPGQGRGELHSGQDTERHLLGIDGMLAVLPAVRHFAYVESGQKKVTVIGHSLGGFQVRVGSMGVVGTLEGKARVSERALRQAKEETEVIVPLFSFGMLDEKSWETISTFKALVLKDLTPFLIECVAVMNCFLPKPIGALNERAFAEYLRFTQGTVHKGLFGAIDPDHEEIKELGSYLLPQNVSRQIRSDMTRWLGDRAFTTSDGLDLGKIWFEQQRSRRAIPSLYIGGQHDGLTEVEPFLAEAESIPGATMAVVPSGHIGSFLSDTYVREMVRLIGTYHRLGFWACEELLEDKRPSRESN